MGVKGVHTNALTLHDQPHTRAMHCNLKGTFVTLMRHFVVLSPAQTRLDDDDDDDRDDPRPNDDPTLSVCPPRKRQSVAK